MIEARVTVVINRCSTDVFAFISNPENNPRWQRGMRECRITSPGPIGRGATYEQVASFLGKRIESQFVIVEFEPGHRIKGTTTAGAFPITFTRTVEAEGDGARVTAVVEGDASGFFRIAAWALRRMVRRSVAADYQRLRRLLESGRTVI